MYSYSPIKKIYIKNFRNIGEAEIDFTESPIVSLIGENEAGKTSVVKAFSVCALHSTPRDQKDYIRDGTQGFGVAIELVDGTMVTRMKTATTNKYSVKYPDGTTWDTTKIDSGLPSQVQNVMGLIEEAETKEYLQVRTYEDQLLFVVTPASTNYKVMYDALKVDQLTRAIKVGSKEANGLKQEIDSCDTGIETLTTSLRGIRTFDIEPLINIKKRVIKELKEVQQLSKAVQLAETIRKQKSSLGAMSLLDSQNISEVSEAETSKILQISNTIENMTVINKELSRLSSIEATDLIDMTEVNKMSSIVDRKEMLDRKIKEAGAVVEVGECDEVDEVSLIALINANSLLTGLNQRKQRFAVLDTTGAETIEQEQLEEINKAASILNISAHQANLIDTEQKLETYCKQVEDYLKACGVDFEVCPKCGESVLIDLDKYSSAM